MSRIWAVCSGSGGVGKTTLALALSAGAAKAGRRVILLDASGTARSADLVLGMESIMVLDLADVAGGEAPLEAALYPAPQRSGLRVASASLYEGASLEAVSGVMLALQSLCDVLVVDLPTGQAGLARGLMSREDELLLVSRPDDASLRACERVMQQARRGSAALSLVLTRTRKDYLRKGVQIEPAAAEMVLDCPVLGVIPEDESIVTGAGKGRTAIECDGPARGAIRKMLEQLLKRA